jgi:hypothetical protein
MPYVSLSRMVAGSGLLAVTAALLVGCGQQDAQGGGPAGTPPVGTASSGTAGGGGTPSRPGTPEPAPAAHEVYFDPDDMRTPRARVLLTGPAEVSRFVTWLDTKPRPGMASDLLVAALRKEPVDDQALLVVSRIVGCDSVGKVELRQQGSNFSVATLDVEHHEECLRANVLVAVFAVPKSALPANPTIDGAAPDTGWR